MGGFFFFRKSVSQNNLSQNIHTPRSLRSRVCLLIEQNIMSWRTEGQRCSRSKSGRPKPSQSQTGSTITPQNISTDKISSVWEQTTAQLLSTFGQSNQGRPSNLINTCMQLNLQSVNVLSYFEILWTWQEDIHVHDVICYFMFCVLFIVYYCTTTAFCSTVI